MRTLNPCVAAVFARCCASLPIAAWSPMWLEQTGTQPLVIGVLTFALEQNGQNLTGAGCCVACIVSSHEYYICHQWPRSQSGFVQLGLSSVAGYTSITSSNPVQCPTRLASQWPRHSLRKMVHHPCGGVSLMNCRLLPCSIRTQENMHNTSSATGSNVVGCQVNQIFCLDTSRQKHACWLLRTQNDATC